MAKDVFEIHVDREGRWTIDQTAATEKEAVAVARSLLNGKGVEGVKVIHEGANRFGRATSNTVFEQRRERNRDDRIQIAPISSAPRCQKRDDLYGPEARQTMSKLFRNYVTKMALTPTEVMHNAREMKRVLDKDTLVSSAVSRVASLQCNGNPNESKARRDELFAYIDSITVRAREAERIALPSIAQVGYAELATKVAEQAPDPDENSFLMRVAITRDLIGERSLFGKLDTATRWAEDAPSESPLNILDDFISDTLADATVVQDLLGTKPNLAKALLALVDLSEGKLAESGKTDARVKESEEIGQRLGALLAAARLPGANRTILERVRGEIGGGSPLDRSGDDTAALSELMARLVPPDAPIKGGPDMAAALVERASRVLGEGGNAGRVNATQFASNLLDSVPARLRFLIGTYESALRVTIGEGILGLLQAWIGSVESVSNLVRDTRAPDRVMRSITSLFHQIMGTHLPSDIKQLLGGHLDGLLLKYITDENILQRIDDPARPLRTRARMLMSLCLPEMLPPGRAVGEARQLIVNYLRQPNFEIEVVADIADEAARARELRDFFELMRRAGFR